MSIDVVNRFGRLSTGEVRSDMEGNLLITTWALNLAKGTSLLGVRQEAKDYHCLSQGVSDGERENLGRQLHERCNALNVISCKQPYSKSKRLATALEADEFGAVTPKWHSDKLSTGNEDATEAGQQYSARRVYSRNEIEGGWHD